MNLDTVFSMRRHESYDASFYGVGLPFGSSLLAFWSLFRILVPIFPDMTWLTGHQYAPYDMEQQKQIRIASRPTVMTLTLKRSLSAV